MSDRGSDRGPDDHHEEDPTITRIREEEQRVESLELELGVSRNRLAALRLGA